jgi:ketosteroid isomerase-like protein
VSLQVHAQGEYIDSARSFYDAWNTRDVEKAIKYFSSDIVFNDAQYDVPFTGISEVKQVNLIFSTPCV